MIRLLFFNLTFPQSLQPKAPFISFGLIIILMYESLDLVEIASKHILLQQSRKALKGRCPFHKDQTTSLMIIPQSNVFKCFGCGIEGGPVEFLMNIEGKSRTEIIGQLALQNFPA